MEELVRNPGLLKLELMLKGVNLSSSFTQRNPETTQPFFLGPHCYGNLDLILPNNTYVSVPYQEGFTKESPYSLRHDKNGTYLALDQTRLRVHYLRHPDIYSRPATPEAKIGEVLCAHGGYVSLALGGHRYLQPTLVGEKGETNRPHLVVGVDDTIKMLKLLASKRAIDVVSLSCWHPNETDGGIFQIEPYIRAIKKNFNVLVFVEVHAPLKNSVIDASYAIGADSVCYHIGNLCSHGEVKSNGHDLAATVDKLKHAVRVFPPGSVLAHITAGETPLQDTFQDIEELIKIKVLPILTVESLEIAHRLKFDAALLAPLFGQIYNLAKKNKIKMNWFSKLAPFVAPIEGRYFTGDLPRFKLAIMNFYQTRLFGGSVSASLSNLRRKLRSKSPSDLE